ncbi:MAG TPA: AsnC family transcriptional regulator [Candidatus Nanoarchaeia archaeon]|nr:AsnC family transcriptional regulator [Candidatus Nanoarchaeia archaeon]
MAKDIKELLEKYEDDDLSSKIDFGENLKEIKIKDAMNNTAKENKIADPNRTIKLDAYDKKILEILLNNAREHISVIGKKIRLRRENVNYKINRLIKAGLIKEFNIVLNEKKLGLAHYVVLLELANLKEKSEEEIINYLKESRYMTWIGPAAGRWSLIFDIILPERVELSEVINEFLTKFKKYIDEYVVLRWEEGSHFGFKFLGSKERGKRLEFSSEKVNLDKKDAHIISLLNTDARASLVDISEKVGLTPNGAGNRIKKLEKEGVILGYTISLDWKKLGYEWYGIQLKLIKFGEEINKRLVDFFTKHKRITFYSRYIGAAWDYDIGLLGKSSVELRNFINEFRAQFSDIAKIYNVILPLEEITGYKLPNGVFATN